MCPGKDKETGMVAFNFNIVEEESEVSKDEDEGDWKMWQWGDIVHRMKVKTTCIMIKNDKNSEKNNKDHEEVFVAVNQY
jgi:hypothetical protein